MSDSRQDRPEAPGRPNRMRVIWLLMAAVVVIAVVAAFLAFRGDSGGGSGSGLGWGSGGQELSGEWDIALTTRSDGEAGVGRISLTEGDEEEVTGTGEVAFPDEAMALSLAGTVEEQDSGVRSVNLASTDGSYQLRGTVADDSMEGSAVWAEADAGGAFSAIRAGDVGGDSPRKAISRYLRAWSFADGITDEKFLDGIEATVVAPLYWSSPAGESSRQVAEDLSGSEEKMSMDLSLVEFVASEEDEAEAAGTIRYEQNYRAGEDRGSFSGAVPARIVRWGEGYRVLSGGVEMLDPQAYLGGEWRVTTHNESEYFADPDSSDLIFGPEGFVMTLDSFSPDGDGSYGIEGTAEGAVIGPADVTGDASVADDGSLDVGLSLEAQRDSGGVHDMGLSDIELTDEGLEGGAIDNSTGAVSTPYADFVAVRERAAETEQGGKR